jgi:hypothetical protein
LEHDATQPRIKIIALDALQWCHVVFPEKHFAQINRGISRSASFASKMHLLLSLIKTLAQKKFCNINTAPDAGVLCL